MYYLLCENAAPSDGSSDTHLIEDIPFSTRALLCWRGPVQPNEICRRNEDFLSGVFSPLEQAAPFIVLPSPVFYHRGVARAFSPNSSALPGSNAVPRASVSFFPPWFSDIMRRVVFLTFVLRMSLRLTSLLTTRWDPVSLGALLLIRWPLPSEEYCHRTND